MSAIDTIDETSGDAAGIAPDAPDARRAEAAFIASARALVKDLFHPRPAIYWAALLASAAVGYAGFYFPHDGRLPLAVRAGLFVVSALAFYRAALFIHELVHLNGSELRGFRFAW